MSREGRGRSWDSLAVELLRVGNLALLSELSSPLPASVLLDLARHPRLPVSLQPGKGKLQKLGSGPLGVLHRDTDTVGDTGSILTGDSDGGELDGPGNGRRGDRGTELDVDEVGGESVESVEDVGRVEDGSVALLGLLGEEVEETLTDEDVEVDRDL